MSIRWKRPSSSEGMGSFAADEKPKAHLRGQILNGRGEPLEGVMVALDYGNFFSKRRTGSDGEFEFTLDPEGTFEIRAGGAQAASISASIAPPNFIAAEMFIRRSCAR